MGINSRRSACFTERGGSLSIFLPLSASIAGGEEREKKLPCCFPEVVPVRDANVSTVLQTCSSPMEVKKSFAIGFCRNRIRPLVFQSSKPAITCHRGN